MKQFEVIRYKIRLDIKNLQNVANSLRVSFKSGNRDFSTVIHKAEVNTSNFTVVGVSTKWFFQREAAPYAFFPAKGKQYLN